MNLHPDFVNLMTHLGHNVGDVDFAEKALVENARLVEDALSKGDLAMVALLERDRAELTEAAGWQRLGDDVARERQS